MRFSFHTHPSHMDCPCHKKRKQAIQGASLRKNHTPLVIANYIITYMHHMREPLDIHTVLERLNLPPSYACDKVVLNTLDKTPLVQLENTTLTWKGRIANIHDKKSLVQYMDSLPPTALVSVEDLAPSYCGASTDALLTVESRPDRYSLVSGNTIACVSKGHFEETESIRRFWS